LGTEKLLNDESPRRQTDGNVQLPLYNEPSDQPIEHINTCANLMNDSNQYSHISRILTNPNVLQNPASFFDVYQLPVRKFFMCLCGNAHEADEQFQEFAVKFLSGAFDSFEPDKGRFRDYLKTALRNQVKRSYKKGANFLVPIPEDMDAADPNALQPIENALREFDTIEGEQIKQMVDSDMQADEADGKNQYHSLLQFAVDYQRERLHEYTVSGGRTKIPVAAIADFFLDRFGETVTSDTAKQRMFRAKVMYASKMIDEIGVRVTDPSHSAIREASRELGLAVYVESELLRRESKLAGD
jgi:RNA polymerase sigma factor (sigma-70 family)